MPRVALLYKPAIYNSLLFGQKVVNALHMELANPTLITLLWDTISLLFNNKVVKKLSQKGVVS